MHESSELSSPTPPVIVTEKSVNALEVISVLATVIVADVTIFRGGGFTGCAVLLTAVPALLFAGSPSRQPLRPVWLIGFALLAVAVRLIWHGSIVTVCCGLTLTCVFALAMAGRTIHLFESFIFAWYVIPSGMLACVPYWNISKQIVTHISTKWLNVLLPALALVTFGMLFVVANPDLAHLFSENLANLVRHLEKWLIHTSPSELGFLSVTAIVFLGLLKPLPVIKQLTDRSQPHQTKSPEASSFYVAFRNTMVTVTLLFAVYLVFEFQTLWFREFPEGFYYSGYAHQGAAWLTAALAIATGILSLIFRGTVLADPRIDRLKVLAWIWSLENMVLGLAVFHRVFIYINFNGMTRMRVIALFGISSVITGFIMVVIKIIRNRSFLWLLRAHLFTLMTAVFLYCLTPVDWFVTGYNVRRILSGDLAPAVQVSVHPISAEGLLLLRPLVNHKNETIREGVRAVLAEAHLNAESNATMLKKRNWSYYQIADQWVLSGLRIHKDQWLDHYQNAGKRSTAYQRFADFVYQWY